MTKCMDVSALRDTRNYVKMLISITFQLYNFRRFSFSYSFIHCLIFYLCYLYKPNFHFTFQRKNTNMNVWHENMLCILNNNYVAHIEHENTNMQEDWVLEAISLLYTWIEKLYSKSTCLPIIFSWNQME